MATAFAGIEDAATADRGNDVGAVLARGGDAGPGQLDRGLGATANTAAGSPSPASSPAWRAGSAPVHTSTRDPSPASTPGSSAARPAPAMMRPAVANSKAGRRHGEPLAQPSPAAGNTAEYWSDARGPAIIWATASRQAA